jgi:hypothetical protein
MRNLGIVAVAMALAGCASSAAETPSTADLIANADIVPSPRALPSMPSAEWCKTVDAALANPRTDHARREEYIATGQAHQCPHQMFLEPGKGAAASPPPMSPEEWCATAFKGLANPYGSEYLKAALLEKARNRGCLK